jgi:hypothetical protein
MLYTPVRYKWTTIMEILVGKIFTRVMVSTADMNKFTWAICLTVALAFGLSMTHNTSGQMAFAQMNKTKSIDVTNTGRNSPLTSANDTFSAIGTISSLNFYNNSAPNIADSKKVILSGDWSINVHNGSVSFFEADFVAAPADGGVSHTHELVNFTVKDAKPIDLSANGSTSIVGTADVKLNGINYWNDVKTMILLSKGSTITIILNDTDTQQHFMRQPIYGIVDRLMY